MKKKILVVLLLLATTFSVTLAVLNSSPKIDVGKVWIEYNGEKISPYVFNEITTQNGKTKKQNTPNLSQIFKNAPALTLEIDKNAVHGEQFLSDITVKIQGDLQQNVTYTVYDENQNVLEQPSSQLKIPAGEIDKCFVKITAIWGDNQNFTQIQYFFAVNFNYV